MNSFFFKTRTVNAILFIRLIAMEKDGWPVPVIAMERIGITRANCVSIARDLLAAGLILAKEGRNGGYILAKAPETISIYDIASAVETGNELEIPANLDRVFGEMASLAKKYALSDLVK